VTVVVTGAGGHLAANLIRLLVEKGRKVRALVHTDARALEGLDVEIARADVLDYSALLKAFEGAEVVYHLAAVISISGGQAGLVERVNVDGPRNVVKACLKTGRNRV
jgi:dihydroflavonol-4-reductase